MDTLDTALNYDLLLLIIARGSKKIIRKKFRF